MSLHVTKFRNEETISVPHSMPPGTRLIEPVQLEMVAMAEEILTNCTGALGASSQM